MRSRELVFQTWETNKTRIKEQFILNHYNRN